MSVSIGRIAAELEAATSAKKCHACGCFQDSVIALQKTELAASLSGPLSEANSVFGDRRYDCLGCDVCWPANALNLAAEAVELPAGAGCPMEAPQPTAGWPPLVGDYQVIRFTAPVAVCTLHSKELVADVVRAAPRGLSIVGSLQTENLGIERVVENVVANPNLRFVVLCGDDTPGAVGHYPGQSLMALARNGTDERGRIQGAKGKRPWIKNLDRDVLSHFRERVEVIDAIGIHDLVRIAGHVEGCEDRDPGPARRAPQVVRRVSVLRARGTDRLVMDPAGYLVVTPDRRRKLIAVEHYGNDGVLRTVVEGKQAEELAATLIREKLVTRLDHAAYVGRELARAEIALQTGRPYIQDRAPDGTLPAGANAEPEDVRGTPGGKCSCEEAS
jgi:tetrahydromethanopterin S-methyltransferase subunit A